MLLVGSGASSLQLILEACRCHQPQGASKDCSRIRKNSDAMGKSQEFLDELNQRLQKTLHERSAAEESTEPAGRQHRVNSLLDL